MTLEELMARAEAGQTARGGATLTNLSEVMYGERADIREGERTYDEDLLSYEDKMQAQAESDSLFDAGGVAIGALFGGPVGSLFTAAGRTATRKEYKAPTLKLKGGMFYDQERKDLASNVESTRKFIESANDTYLADVLADAAKVGLTAGNIRKAFPGLEASGSLLTGDASLSDLFSYDPLTTGALPGADIQGLAEKTGGELLDFSLFDPTTGRSAFDRLDSGFSTSGLFGSRFDPMTGSRLFSTDFNN